MKNYKADKNFLEKKKIRIARQKVMNDVLLAIKLAKDKIEHRFYIDNYIVTSTWKNLYKLNEYCHAFAIIRMKHGYALGNICTKGKSYADLINSNISTDVSRI